MPCLAKATLLGPWKPLTSPSIRGHVLPQPSGKAVGQRPWIPWLRKHPRKAQALLHERLLCPGTVLARGLPAVAVWIPLVAVPTQALVFFLEMNQQRASDSFPGLPGGLCQGGLTVPEFCLGARDPQTLGHATGQCPIPESMVDGSERAQEGRGGTPFHRESQNPLKGRPRGKMKAFNCYCKCAFFSAGRVEIKAWRK